MQNNQTDIVVLTDYDDSLFDNTREVPCDGAEPVAVDEKGRVCGFITPKQRILVDMMARNAMIVPTTARSSKGYKQVSLPIAPGYAIVSFGGVILMPDGTPEPRYHALMQSEAAKHEAMLNELLQVVQQTAASHGIDVRAKVVVDAELPLFVSVKHNDKSKKHELAVLRDAVAAIAPADWQIHLNGNFLAAMPPSIRKESAAQWFLDNIAPKGALVIGVGDSHTDLAFMSLCDYALMPSASQNFLSLNTRGL